MMGGRIMTVDDSRSFRMLIGHSLRQAGYEVVEAADGEECLAKLEEEAIDLIITDLNMPGMDGIELIGKIRALAPWTETPILLLTTEEGDELIDSAETAGATGWIVKPFEEEMLLSVVGELLR